MCYEDFNKAHDYLKKGFNTAKILGLFALLPTKE